MGAISKYGLFTINFCVVVVGLAVVGVASAILNQNSIFDVLLTQVFFAIPLSALLGGLFIVFLGLLGCVGAARENSCMLIMYASIVTVLLVGVLVVGGALLALTSNTSSFLTDGMRGIFEQYGGKDQDALTYDLDLVQNTVHCCGVDNYMDWYSLPYGAESDNVPDGCCRNMTEGCGLGLLQDPDVVNLVYVNGCLSFVVIALQQLGTVLAVLTLLLASFQVLSIAWAILITKEAKGRNVKQKKVKKYQPMN